MKRRKYVKENFESKYFRNLPLLMKSWESVVSIMTNYGLDGPNFKPW
jgi:hypothetical protein